MSVGRTCTKCGSRRFNAWNRCMDCRNARGRVRTARIKQNGGTHKAWCIQRAWGGGQGHRMYLEPPLDFPEGHPLHGAEPLVFRRSFEGMSNYDPPIELNQKLVHSLGLHFIPERNAYCRLDTEGDLEEVKRLRSTARWLRIFVLFARAAMKPLMPSSQRCEANGSRDASNAKAGGRLELY